QDVGLAAGGDHRGHAGAGHDPRRADLRRHAAQADAAGAAARDRDGLALDVADDRHPDAGGIAHALDVGEHHERVGRHQVHAERDRAGADDHDLDVAPAQLGDLIGDRGGPAGGAVGEQAAADLDHDAARLAELVAVLGHFWFAATRARHRRSNVSSALSRYGLTSAESWTSTAATARD